MQRTRGGRAWVAVPGLAFLGLLAVLTLACGAQGAPSINITYPAEGAVFPLNWTNISVEAGDFVLDPAAIGQAPVAGRGHYHVFLDGVYLFYGPSTTFVLKDLAAGAHTIRVQLHNNDHTPITPPTWDEVNVTVGGDKAGVEVTSPREGAAIWGDSVTVTVAVENFTLDAAAINSGGVQGRGHWHVFVDDAYVTMVTTTSVVLEGLAPGTHTLRATLFNNDHTPLGVPVSDAVTVEVAPVPNVTISSPANGAQVAAGDVTITLVVEDLVLDAAAIGGLPRAGHGNYEVRVDGAFHGTGTNLTYSVGGLAAGDHVILVSLHNNDHSPIPGAAGANVTVRVVEPGGFMPGPGAGPVAVAFVLAAIACAAATGRLRVRREE